MATISQVVHDMMMATSAITSVIGTRCYLLAFPADPTFPLVVYRQVGGNEILRSAPKDDIEMSTRFQVDIYGHQYAHTQALRTAIIDLFTGYRGAVSGKTILSSKVDLTFDVYENDSMLYRHVVDFSIQHVGA